MPRTLLTFLAIVLIAGTAVSQKSEEVYFAQQPTLSPDGSFIVYAAQGDLWKVDANGGIAVRLTAMPGDESRPRISPDGKWLAFTGMQFGNQDVYVMPLAGGEIKQLTFHEAADQVESWSWDGKEIYFCSGALNDFTEYKIPVTGGTPERLYGNYFNNLNNVAESPTGELFFSDTWESKAMAMRKGYKGAFHPRIQSYNPMTKEYKDYDPTYNGKQLWVSIDKNGKIYFASDTWNGQYNLATFENGTKTQLTNFTTSIKFPQVSADGRKVVFEHDYQLWVYDVAAKTAKKVDVTANPASTLERSSDFNVQGNISNFDVSPDGKKLAFVSRGLLFASDMQGKFIRRLPTPEGERVEEVDWLSDSKRILYNRTVKGYTNWFVISADSTAVEKQLTHDAQNDREAVLTKDRTKAVYYRGTTDVQVMDLKSFDVNTAVKEEIWGFENTDPSWSPNGEYILFTSHRNFEEDIFVHRLSDHTTLNLTHTAVTETSPNWSPDGKYIYFATNRTEPGYPTGLQNSRIYRLALSKIEKPFKSDFYNGLFKEEPKKDDDKKDKKDDDRKDEKKIVINIDTVGIADRWEHIGPDFGSQNNPYVIDKDSGKCVVLYTSDHSEGKTSIWKTTLSPFDAPKTEMISGSEGAGLPPVVADGKYYTLINGSIAKIDVDGGKLDKIDFSYTFRKNLREEFSQMFEETWANINENYADPNYNGADWKALHEYYAPFIPHISTRSELRVVLTDMLGDLRSSHVGFSSNGKEEDTYYKSATVEPGLLFDNAHPYTVSEIVRKGPADVEGMDVKPGDVLTKVNGEPVDPAKNRDSYFIRPSMDEEIQLTFSRDGAEHTVKIHPESNGAMKGQLYDKWIEGCRKTVDAKSGGRIGYSYMKNMGGDALEKFLEDMVSTAFNKDGLILDLRYNTGGNVHDAVLRFLTQKPYLKWKYRDGAFTVQPNFAPAAKPMVLMVNEQTLSDGEMTATGFKQLGLGKIIGTETYRWIIFTSGKSLVDGSFYRLPSWGCYRLDGTNIERAGVVPDVPVDDTFLDKINNRDPQLDKAIEVVMSEIANGK